MARLDCRICQGDGSVQCWAKHDSDKTITTFIRSCVCDQGTSEIRLREGEVKITEEEFARLKKENWKIVHPD